MLREAAYRTAPLGQQIANGKSLPAPVEGWDASTPLSDMSPKRAILLDNWFPTPTDVRVRRGYQVHSAGMGSKVVDSLLVYHGLMASTSRLFAATDGKIFDVTTSQANATQALTGLTSNRWQYVNFTVPGGKYLWACNGVDNARHFDGTNWAAPSLTITGFSSNNIINVNRHKNRLWFVFKDSTVAGYLPTGAIAGTVTNFELGGEFSKGGYLVAMATWTRDGGDGEDDLAVFISSQGQAAVYAGTDPDSASTWALVGTFDLAPPIGYRCFTKAGGDVALITIDGVLPLSLALQRDRSGTADIALTSRIRNAMNAAARSYKANFGWEILPYPQGGYVLLNVPLQQGVTQHQYVMNTETGAWCRFTAQNANCWAVFNEELYFGGNTGLVNKADQTALDADDPITATGQAAYNYYGSKGIVKDFKLLQAVITADSNIRPALGISTDFRDNAVLGTASSAEEATAQYDSAVFDTDVYPIEDRIVADWASISGQGYAASIHFRAETGRAGVSLWGDGLWGQDVWSAPISGEAVMRLNAFNIVYERGLVL